MGVIAITPSLCDWRIEWLRRMGMENDELLVKQSSETRLACCCRGLLQLFSVHGLLGMESQPGQAFPMGKHTLL